MFFDISGEVFRFLLKTDVGVWAVSYDNPAAPVFLADACFDTCKRLPAPVGYGGDEVLTEPQSRRMGLISPLLDNPIYIADSAARRDEAARIAQENSTTARRILKLFYRYLSHGTLGVKRNTVKGEQDKKYADFRWAIEAFYFSAKKMPLRMAYDLMLTQKYMKDGKLAAGAPTWDSFRHFYYDKGFHRRIRKSVSRNGLSNYQRKQRIIGGCAMFWKDKTGAFQMDATEADIYLVSRFDRSAVVGRPYIYLAVDTATQLIAGVYVGLKSGDEAVMACLANAAMDKVLFCQSYGIDIRSDQWPNTGLPGEIVTDQGREFMGARMDELCEQYGMERETLPPFRPDCKGLVEKSFDLIQQRYKPLLRGKGVIEPDAQERWAVDYRSQAALDLAEFTRIVIHCIIYINSSHVLKSFAHTAETAGDGVLPIPANLWRWYEGMGRTNLIPVLEEDIHRMTLKRTQTRLTRRGIEHEGLYYLSDEYSRLLQEYGTRREVTVGYDSDYTDRIYLIDAGKYLPLSLAASCLQYKGLTAREYGLFREKDQQQKRLLHQRETEARAATLLHISEIAEGTVHTEKGRQTGEVIRQNRSIERGKRG